MRPRAVGGRGRHSKGAAHLGEHQVDRRRRCGRLPRAPGKASALRTSLWRPVRRCRASVEPGPRLARRALHRRVRLGRLARWRGTGRIGRPGPPAVLVPGPPARCGRRSRWLPRQRSRAARAPVQVRLPILAERHGSFRTCRCGRSRAGPPSSPVGGRRRSPARVFAPDQDRIGDPNASPGPFATVSAAAESPVPMAATTSAPIPQHAIGLTHAFLHRCVQHQGGVPPSTVRDDDGSRIPMNDVSTRAPAATLPVLGPPRLWR